MDGEKAKDNTAGVWTCNVYIGPYVQLYCTQPSIQLRGEYFSNVEPKPRQKSLLVSGRHKQRKRLMTHVIPPEIFASLVYGFAPINYRGVTIQVSTLT